jgi:hypothetical protein
MELSGYGISSELPSGWEGRIMKRAEPVPGQGSGPDPALLASVPATPEGGSGRGPAARGVQKYSPERTYPIVHLANFAIPDDRGDFGSGAVELMGNDDAFVTLFEYGPESVDQPLFATQGMPRTLTPDQFQPNALQRTIAGQGGVQLFFSENGRAFCLFVALGSYANRAALTKKVNAALATITIGPA